MIMLMLAGGVFLDTLVYYSEKGVESSIFQSLFFHGPLLMRDDVRWSFPGDCCVSEFSVWHSP